MLRPVPKTRTSSHLALALLVLMLASGCAANDPGSMTRELTAGPPWQLNLGRSAAHIAAAGLTALPQETLTVHYHAHLDIVVDGVSIPVPASLGIVTRKKGSNLELAAIAPLHTHDATGVIHIEAPRAVPFRLGQVFREWGLRLDTRCIGGLCSSAGTGVRVSVNGAVVSGDPAQILLIKHQEITVQYGELTSLPPAASSYAFAPSQ